MTSAAGEVDEGGFRHSDDVDDLPSEGMSLSVEVGVEVGIVVGIRRLRTPDDDNLLGEVGGSTSRSCDGLLFLREVGGIGLYLRSTEDASSAELEEKVGHGVVEFTRGTGARRLRRLGAMAPKGLAVANVSFWVPQGGGNRVPHTLRSASHGRRR